jgi:hypothetical protein
MKPNFSRKKIFDKPYSIYRLIAFLYYLCVSSYNTYQERLREWPCDALATIRIGNGANSIPYLRDS